MKLSATRRALLAAGARRRAAAPPRPPAAAAPSAAAAAGRRPADDLRRAAASTRSGVTSVDPQPQRLARPATSAGSCAVSGMPAITSTPCVSPARGDARHRPTRPARSVTSGSWARSSSVCDGDRPAPSRLKDAASRPITDRTWTAASTSPPPACSPSRSGRTRSPTTSPTRRRPATRPTARRSSSFGDLLLRQLGHRRHRRPAEHGRPGRPASSTDFTPPSRAATPASRSTSRSPATASSPSRPTRARATRATASSPLDAQGRLVTAAGRPGARPRRPADHRRRRRQGRPAPRSASSTSRTRARRATTSSPARRRGAATGHVRSGALEGSGADAARSMVDMIASMRAFEAGQKVIQTIDETLGKAAAGRPSAAAVTGAQVSALDRAEDSRTSMLEGLEPPPPAWRPSSSASTPSPTTSRTRTRRATSTARRLPRPRLRPGRPLRRPGRRAPAPAPRAVDAGRGFAQGALQRTDRPLDVAIQGEGFLQVKLADGRQALTRDGGLHLDGSRPPRPPAPARSCSRRSRCPQGIAEDRDLDRPATAPCSPPAAASAASSSSPSARPQRPDVRRRQRLRHHRRLRHAVAAPRATVADPGRARGLQRRHGRGDGRR